MSEKERLVELLLESEPIKERDLDDGWEDNEISDIAEYLLENGVIVLPCKVGDTVYQTDTAGQIYASTVKNIIYDTSSIAFDERAIGTTVFLTKEQAEKALKGGAKNE